MRGGEADEGSDAPWFVRAHPDDEAAVGVGCEDLGAEKDSARAVFCRGDSRVEVQRSAIIRNRIRHWRVQPQVAERLVGFLPERLAHEFFARQRDSLFLLGLRSGHELCRFAGAVRVLFQALVFQRPRFLEQAADFRERGGGPLMRVAVRFPGPDRVFVELDAFGADSAEDHRAEEAVAHRQGLGPILRGLLIPEVPPAIRASGLGVDCSGKSRDGGRSGPVEIDSADGGLDHVS